MKHCCVIGGGGFIGGHIVERLILRQRRVTAIDTNPAPSRPGPRQLRYITGDYSVKSFLMEVLQDVNEIIHLAYSTVPKTSFEDPLQDISDNLPTTVTLLEAASTVGVDKFVLMSSGGTVYGKVDKVPIREDHTTNPISPYGITKLATEKYDIMFGELKGLPVICVRPGIIAVLDGGAQGACYNIGTGIGRSNKDILDAIAPLAESAGFEVRVKTLPARPFDVPVNVLNSTKLKEETGWKPAVSFEEGIEKTWNWFARH